MHQRRPLDVALERVQTWRLLIHLSHHGRGSRSIIDEHPDMVDNRSRQIAQKCKLMIRLRLRFYLNNRLPACVASPARREGRAEITTRYTYSSSSATLFPRYSAALSPSVPLRLFAVRDLTSPRIASENYPRKTVRARTGPGARLVLTRGPRRRL